MLREAIDLAVDFIGFCTLIVTVASVTIFAAAAIGALP